MITDQSAGRTVYLGKKAYLFFSGFSYLGMSDNPIFRKLVQEGVEKYGIVFPSSRIGNVKLQLFETLEAQLTTIFRQAAAVSFSSGYLAAQAAVQLAAQRGTLLYAPHTHPALWLPHPALPDQPWDDWVEHTIEQVQTQPQKAFVIIADAVNPLIGKVNDFSWLARLTVPVTVLIDDSHGAGVLGESGEGIAGLLPKQENIDYLICCSLAKAYGITGGMVAGSQKNIQTLRQLPLYTASTGLSPALAHAFLHASALYQEARDQLRAHVIQFIQALLPPHSLQFDPRLPIFHVQQHELYPHCFEQLMILSCFSYPQPQDPPITRIVINAAHTRHDILQLAAAVNDFFH